MNNRGFNSEIDLKETPDFKGTEEKSLNFESNQYKKVDINILKARVQEKINKENRKNIIIFVTLILILGVTSVYLSI